MIYNNTRKNQKLETLSDQISIYNGDDLLTKKCKFNFAYFCKQESSQDFNEWEENKLITLLNSLKEYSKKSLEEWKSDGKLVIYGDFPKKTKFDEPKHVPLEAQWGRFRMSGKIRLIGFVLHIDTVHEKTGIRFDKNTFYIVFLDKNHHFYLCETK